MAFASAQSPTEPRAWSVGPVKMELHTYTAASGDTGGTVTAQSMERVDHALVDGVIHTAIPSISGKTVTLAFQDPGASGAAGTIILIGK